MLEPDYSDWYEPLDQGEQALTYTIAGKPVKCRPVTEKTLEECKKIVEALTGQGLDEALFNPNKQSLLDALLAYHFFEVDIPRVKAARPDIYAELLNRLNLLLTGAHG